MGDAERERIRVRDGKRKSSEFLSPTQVANLLGLSRWTLIYWRRRRFGPEFVKLSRNIVRYPRERFEVWLKSSALL